MSIPERQYGMAGWSGRHQDCTGGPSTPGDEAFGPSWHARAGLAAVLAVWDTLAARPGAVLA